MCFLIEDMTYLKNRKSALILKKELDSEPTYKKGFLKTEIKAHGDELPNFQDKQIPKLDSSYSCLAVIGLDSALKKDENSLSTSLFKRVCKYIEKKVVRHIITGLGSFYDDSNDSNDSDEE